MNCGRSHGVLNVVASTGEPSFHASVPLFTALFSELAIIVHAGQNWRTDLHPERDSTALRVLFELVVSPWPLILWVAFRAVINDRTDLLQTFLDIVRGPDEDLFAWDDVDDTIFYQALMKERELGLFPQDWNQYMVQIDIRAWLQIKNTTWTVYRPRYEPENLWIRLAAVSLRFSSSLSIPQNILSPFDLSLDQFPFASVAHVILKNYQKQLPFCNFESKEFWASPNLGNWLSASTQDLCNAIWLTSSKMSILRRVQLIHLVLDRTVLPKVVAFVCISLVFAC
jgi:hypothetical protein